ncbi:restriction endonuclease subunit S [Klebsiella sp. 1SOBk8mer]|uniref:restriction endonuclease subunit S n=1 Tax=Klebsiella TaxID=570 RepID=UPI00108244BA|nr:restriction endonuclease subunit S [Klebsiella pneumoniae]UAA28964.1 restriction endonuclease subunit S [Klebsiella pneumoniae]VGL24760.1 Restriction modification system DNA specificity domain protein [Klebsiella pneumoniae]VGL69757.1 Restriction modification system DNA specificity domain protein [Klebsiella pneumoniae]GHK13234.1 type I restriction system specificity protein [Klebsiella pneumoniae]HBR2306722.1 restriction endonuclease subunit S [Klebsiella pneumoniae]
MSELSYLEKLLDGVKVEWLPLGNVTKYEQPTKYLVKAKDYHDTFSIPVLTAGKTFILGYTDETHGIYEASKTPVIIFDDFTTANKWVDFDFKAKSSAMKMITSSDDIKFSLKYVYYWLNTLPNELVDGDHKRQWISNYAQKKVPVPCPDNPEKSLAIQSEIVRILDKFTALTAELTAELTMRKKQYNYYRDQLLSFKEGEVEWKTLGEVATFRRGTAITQKQTTPGDIPVVANGPTPTYFHSKSNRQDETIVIARSGAYAGYVSFWNQPIFLTDAFSVHPNLKIVKPKFLYYVLQNKQEHIHAMKKGAGVPHVRVKEFESYDVPIPPLAEQVRIVTILDKFDTLTNSITEGLPREIELRQKQYEYYRDMLFSFPKPDVVEA